MNAWIVAVFLCVALAKGGSHGGSNSTAASGETMKEMMMKKDAANKQWDKVIAAEMMSDPNKTVGAMKACNTCNKLAARSKAGGGLGCMQLKMWAQYVKVPSYMLEREMKAYISNNFKDEATKKSPQLPMNCQSIYEGACNPEGAIDVCMRKEGLMELSFKSAEQILMNETNETEYEVYMLPTPMPTNPISQVQVSTKLTGKALDAIPDMTALKAAMVSSLGSDVKAEDVTATVEYTLSATFTFDKIVPTQEVASQAFADLYGVEQTMVTVTITAKRRLRGQERRLAGATVAAEIKVQDAAKVDKLAEAGKDLATIQKSFADTYVKAHKAVTGKTIDAPTVTAAAPEVQMDIKYEIKSTTATSVAIPTPTALKAAFEARPELKAIANTLTLATPAPTAAPTALPAGDTFMPTRAPTFAPETTTMMPVATPDPTMMSVDATPVPTMAATAPAPAPNTTDGSNTTMAPATKKGAAESGAPSSLRLSVTALACAIAAVLAQ